MGVKCQFRSFHGCIRHRVRRLLAGARLAGEFMAWARDKSIPFKELFTIMMALVTWGPQWQGTKFQFFCDNKAVCHTLHFKNSCQPHLVVLLNTLYALSAQFGCLISACHLPGVMNTLLDALSHGWLQQFFEQQGRCLAWHWWHHPLTGYWMISEGGSASSGD